MDLLEGLSASAVGFSTSEVRGAKELENRPEPNESVVVVKLLIAHG